MGSKPNGIVKVCLQLDPFRSGGAAGPVRRKFKGIATQGGLTVALRPIKQNPQIAGIVIKGYSYSNALREDLPTVSGDPMRNVDFSVLENVRPQKVADPDLHYDPSLNPKFKDSVEDTKSQLYSARTQSAPFGHSIGSAPTLGQSAGLFNTQTGSASNSQSYSYPSSSSGISGASGALSPMSGVNMQSSNPPGPYPSSLLVRPAVAYRRTLTSYPNDYAQPDSDVMSRLESLNSKISQEQLVMNSVSNSAPSTRGMYASHDQAVTLGSPSQGYNNQLSTSARTQGVLSSPEETGSYSPDFQGRTQMAQATGIPQQGEASYSGGTDPTILGDAAQRLYQAQSETMPVRSQYQHESSSSSGAGWPVKQRDSVNQGHQQHHVGMVPASETTDSNFGSSATTHSEGYPSDSYQSASTGAYPYHFDDQRRLSSQTAATTRNERNEARGFPTSDGTSVDDRPSTDSYRMTTEREQMPLGQGAHTSSTTQTDAETSSRHLIQTPHVARLAHPAEGDGEIAQNAVEERKMNSREDNGNIALYREPYASTGAESNGRGAQYPASTRQTVPNVPGLPNIPSLPGLPELPGSESGGGDEGEMPERPPTPGIHNGLTGLDGMCIDNSTHCSCGMVDQTRMRPEECLFVVNEDVSPMICARRPCSGRLVCACAPGANSLCKRSFVKHILVPATIHKHGVTEEPNVVLCKREHIEQGVGVLTPII